MNKKIKNNALGLMYFIFIAAAILCSSCKTTKPQVKTVKYAKQQKHKVHQSNDVFPIIETSAQYPGGRQISTYKPY